jgi:uncharacterized membrane protein
VTASRTRGTALRAATLALATAALVNAVRAARRRRRAWLAAGRYEYRALTETFDLPVDREPLYWLLREPGRAARLVDPDARVTPLDETHSRWTLTGPAGTPVTCAVEVMGDVPELMVSWSVPDGPLPHQGRVQLSPVPAGTRVQVRVRYPWSRRLASEAGITPGDPARVLRRATDRLRTLAAQPLPAQPLPAQPLPGQPFPGQPLPGQPLPGRSGPSGRPGR